MGKALVLIEQRDGKIKKSSLEGIAVAAKGGCEVFAAVLGHGIEGVAKEIGEYGIKKIYLANDAGLKSYLAEPYSQVLCAIIQECAPDFVFASHTPLGKDLLPHVSARLGLGYAPDCTKVQISGNSVVARRPIYAGKATAEVEFIGTGSKLLTLRPNSVGVPAAKPGQTAEVTQFAVKTTGVKAKILETVKGSSARPDVTEAPIVISGGRAMKNAENYKILEELADLLGAAVGASRAAVDAGFRPHRDQVGQTGKVVSPILYIACGISGAIQHLAGMRTSKTIVAINSDPEAPIFQVADYGIVGDLFAVIPVLIKEFKSLKESG